MLRRIKVSPLNNIQFIPSGIERAARYNTNIPYYSWFSETIRPWETPVEYVQKIQNTDPLNIQIRFNLLSLVTPPDASLLLYKCTGELVSTTPFAKPAGAPDVIEEDGRSYRVNAINNALFFSTLDEGRYYFIIRVPFGTPPEFYDEWISEPIEIRAVWEDTILIEYSSTINTLDVIFEQFRQTFSFRIEGALINPKDYVNRVTTQDQAAKTIPLSADAYSGATLSIGGNGGFVPDWAFKKLNSIFTLDVMRLDGFPYTANQGASIERQYIPDYPLFSGAIEVVEADPEKDYAFSRGSLLLFTAPETGAFVIMKVQIGYEGFIMFEVSTPAIINNSGELDTYVLALNAAVVAAGFSGTVTREGDDVQYNLATSDDYDYGYGLILDKFFSIRNVVSSGGNAETDLRLAGYNGNNAPYLVTTVTGTVGPYGYLGDDLMTLNLNTVGVVPGTYFNSVFHNGQIGSIDITGDSVSNFLGATDFPEYLHLFSIVNCGKIDQLNIGMLIEANEVLEFINVQSCPFLQEVGGYYVSGKPWYKLRLLNVLNCVMTTADVNALIEEFGDSMGTGQQLVYNGILSLYDQTPPAPPSGTALALITNLELDYNWEVTTD